MCYVIVTSRSVFWALVVLAGTLVVIVGIITPQWLVGKQKDIAEYGWFDDNATNPAFRPSLGIFNRCSRIPRADMTLRDECGIYVTSLAMPSDDFPSLWKCGLVLFVIACLLLAASLSLCVVALCVRAVGGKSVFTIAGFLQSLAGFFLVVGVLLYPAGWGSHVVRDVCGDRVGPYYLHHCTLGWAFYTTIGGTALVLIGAILSIQAESSTFSEKVEAHLQEGSNPVCVC